MGLATAETDAQRVLRYRNSAQNIRIEAQSIANADEREGLLRIAADFETLAQDIERTAKH